MGKTLKELNVKPGDVVECLSEPYHALIGQMATIQENGWAMFSDGGFFMPECDEEFNREYRIVSRATPEIDLTAITTPLGLLDDATRDSLKAHGGPYEEYCVEGWLDSGPVKHWANADVIRVKPYPKVETVSLTVQKDGAIWNGSSNWIDGSHLITFYLINGKPDTSSIKMEALE